MSFSKPKAPKIPKPEPLPPEPKEGAGNVAALEESKKRRKKARGRQSTILTGDTGGTTLLGG